VVTTSIDLVFTLLQKHASAPTQFAANKHSVWTDIHNEATINVTSSYIATAVDVDGAGASPN
jgi:hypothetical protein